MYRHILLPTDGSELSERAIGAGMRFANSIGAHVTALHVTPPFYPAAMSPSALAAEAEEHKAHSKSSATHALDFAGKAAREAGVACELLHRVSDSPWNEIIASANEQGCDLIFMASHGRRGMGALLLGSQAHEVLTHTAIPVLVCR